MPLTQEAASLITGANATSRLYAAPTRLTTLTSPKAGTAPTELPYTFASRSTTTTREDQQSATPPQRLARNTPSNYLARGERHGAGSLHSCAGPFCAPEARFSPTLPSPPAPARDTPYPSSSPSRACRRRLSPPLGGIRPVKCDRGAKDKKTAAISSRTGCG
ncbi:hypothetical protein VTK56DRAFT_2233 [Thermocarpiscus australiensis]